MDNISIDELGKAIQEIVEEYSEDVRKTVQEVMPIVGRKAVKELKAKSPRKSGNYAKGWKWKIEKQRLGSELVVYNKTRYQVTHLLEKGHANRGGGRTSGIPHIKPTEDMAVKETLQLIKKGLQ